MLSNWYRLLQRACLQSFQPALITVLLILPCSRLTLALAAQTVQSALAAASVSVPATAPFSAAGIGTGARNIDGLWQFHTGDDPDGKLGWVQPGFDDSAWERIPADSPWGDNGHPGYTGFAWYRRQIALDQADKAKLALLLPPLNSVAEVYWNGVKIGGLGKPPPHAIWYLVPRPVAITVPAASGVGGRSSNTLAIRLWMQPLLGLNGGFRSVPILGYAPIVQQTAESWVENRFRVRAIANSAYLIELLVALGSFLLWLRQRTQWLFLGVAFYFGTFLLANSSAFILNFSWVLSESTIQIGEGLGDLSLWMLLLLLLDLRRRPFWLWFTMAMAALDILGVILGIGEDLAVLTHPRLVQVLDVAGQLAAYLPPIVTLLLVAAGLSMRRPRLPVLLLAVAAVFDTFPQELYSLLGQIFTGMNELFAFIYRPLFQIYGSSVYFSTASKLLLLAAMLYAVWDQASQQVARRRVIDAELKSAQEVQQLLVPEAQSGDVSGYAIASVYRPASEVGGDFFQIIPLADQSTLIVAGDVSGKGLRAAMTVSLVVGAIRTLAEQDPAPAAILAGLNRRLIGRTQGGFATCCALLVNPAGHAVMANAAHCQPYIDGQEIELPNGIPLGLVDGVSYEETSLTLPEGAQLVLVSDGVVEARNEKGSLYGFERLNQLVANKPTAEQIADAAVAFGQDDDITVLTLIRHAAA